MYPVSCNERTVVIDKVVIILQDSMDLVKVEPDSGDESEVIEIKIEDTADVKQEEDPLLITLPITDTEHEVSCMSVCCLLKQFSQISKNACCDSQLHLSVHRKQLHFEQQVFKNRTRNVCINCILSHMWP
jgi:hypothetical protein